MTRTFAIGLAVLLSASQAQAAEPQGATGSNDTEVVESLPSSFYELFGLSMPEATSGMKKARVPGSWNQSIAALGVSSIVPFTRTSAETNGACVTVPVYTPGPPISGAALLQTSIVPTAGTSLLKIDFTSSLNLNASGIAFDGGKRDGIALICKVWKQGATEAQKEACPGMGSFPFLISQVSGYNGSARYWAGHVGQGAYTGLVDVSTLNASGWAAGTDPVVVGIQVMKAYNQGGTDSVPVPKSTACYSNLILQAN